MNFGFRIVGAHASADSSEYIGKQRHDEFSYMTRTKAHTISTNSNSLAEPLSYTHFLNAFVQLNKPI